MKKTKRATDFVNWIDSNGEFYEAEYDKKNDYDIQQSIVEQSDKSRFDTMKNDITS